MNKAFETSLSYYGIREIRGEENNPEIMNFFREIGHSWVQGDETAWCSAFVNYCCLVNDLPYSGKLNARSWLNVGGKVSVPSLGDIVVFWRDSKDSWKGHVGFYVTERKGLIYCLGGNQTNMVNISKYPKERVLEYITINKKQ